MSEYQNTQKNNCEHLERLLLYVSPEELRKSVLRTLFAYLLEQDTKGLDSEYKIVVENLHMLTDFFDKLSSDTKTESP